jgi:hypothetical protein
MPWCLLRWVCAQRWGYAPKKQFLAAFDDNRIEFVSGVNQSRINLGALGPHF